MLQEIEPMIFDNQYKNKELTADSKVICICDKEAFLLNTDQENEYVFPMRKQIEKEQLEAIYLFSIDDMDYFYANVDEKWEQEDGFWANGTFLSRMAPRFESFAAMNGWHIGNWYRNNRFCGHCGKPMIHDVKERMMRCEACGLMEFPKIAPAIVVAVRDGERMLLTKYQSGPDQRYALVAGFVEFGETAEQTVARELMEEVGLKVKNIKYYKSQPWGLAGNLMLGYTAEVDGDSVIHRNVDELAVAEWVDRKDIPPIFDHNSLTREMIERFRLNELEF